jgi:hypothetical protein
MKRLMKISAAVLAVGASFVLASSAGADERSRFEIFFRGATSPASGGTTYLHAYDPNPGYKIAGSYLRQTLRIDPLAGWGAQAGITAFLGGIFGARFSLGREERSLGGDKSSYELKYLHTYYIPWQDPSQFDGVYQRTTDWPGASGRLGRTTTALEFVVRIPAGRGINVDLSAGPLLSFWEGSLQSLAYTEMVYSRYGALIFHDSYVRFSLPRRVTLGLTAGAELACRLLEGVSLLLSAAFRSSRYEATSVVAEAYDAFAFLLEDADRMRRIKARITPMPLALSLSPFFFGAGISAAF